MTGKEKYNPYKVTLEAIAKMCEKYNSFTDERANDFANNIRIKCKDAFNYENTLATPELLTEDEK